MRRAAFLTLMLLALSSPGLAQNEAGPELRTRYEY